MLEKRWELLEKENDIITPKIFKFVNDLEECVKEQQNEANKAIMGRGRWSLAANYSSMRVNADNWFGTMSHGEKVEAVSSFHSASRSTDVSTRSMSSLPEQASVSEPGRELSMPYTFISAALSSGELQSLWSKASRLLNQTKVLKAPSSNENTWWVCSDSSPSPHIIVTKSKGHTGRYMCDKQCVGWKSRNICAHCLAVAEDDKQLETFLTWLSTTKSHGSVNLTKAVYHGTYKHAGKKKPPTSRRKYGDSMHLPLHEKTDRIPLSDISNSDVTRLQNEHCYTKKASTCDNLTINDMAVDEEADIAGHITLFPTSTPCVSTSSCPKHKMDGAQIGDMSGTCSTGDTSSTSSNERPLKGGQTRLPQ